MNQLRLVGIGCGDPSQLTLEAVEALRSASFALVSVKAGAAGDDPLAAVRRAILDVHAPGLPVIEIADPERDRSAAATSTTSGYEGVVSDWHAARAAAWEAALESGFREHTPAPSPEMVANRPFSAAKPVGNPPNLENGARGGTGVLLVWGDPAFYDSSIRVVEQILERGRLHVVWDVLPGISALQLLAARHRIVLHEIGQPITVTTARRLQEAVEAGADNILVMLTGRLDLAAVSDWTIWWGANLGAPSEVLVSGRVADVIDRIEGARAEAKAAAGWVMDAYLLRR